MKNNIIVTLVTEYTECHGIFSVKTISEVCRLSGYRGIGFTNIPKYKDLSNEYMIIHVLPKGFKLSKIHEGIDNEFQKYIDSVFFFRSIFEKEEIGIIVNFLEWWFYDYLKTSVKIKADKTVAFLHCFITECLAQSKRFDDDYLIQIQKEVGKFLPNEQRMIDTCDHLLVASLGVAENIKQHFTHLSDLDFTVVEIYSDKIPLFAKKPLLDNYHKPNAFFVGKMDLQDGFWRLSESDNILKIGDRIFDRKTTTAGFIASWDELIDDIPFGILPAPYETRGLIPQEIQALGRIPLVDRYNKGSAEQIEHAKTGFLIDFNQSWKSQIDDILNVYPNEELKQIAAAARFSLDNRYIDFAKSLSKSLITLGEKLEVNMI